MLMASNKIEVLENASAGIKSVQTENINLRGLKHSLRNFTLDNNRYVANTLLCGHNMEQAEKDRGRETKKKTKKRSRETC